MAEYILTVAEATSKRPVVSHFGSHPISLHFPTREAADEFEKAEYDMRLRAYWKIREAFGIFASNQNCYVNSYSDLNEWDNKSVEHKCIAAYGPRGFNLRDFLLVEMNRYVLNRVFFWKGDPKVRDFMALRLYDVQRYISKTEKAWIEIKRCQDLYLDRYGMPIGMWDFLVANMPADVLTDLREIGIASWRDFFDLDVDMTKAYETRTWEHVRNAQRFLKEQYGNHPSFSREEKEAQSD